MDSEKNAAPPVVTDRRRFGVVDGGKANVIKTIVEANEQSRAEQRLADQAGAPERAKDGREVPVVAMVKDAYLKFERARVALEPERIVIVMVCADCGKRVSPLLADGAAFLACECKARRPV